MFIFRLISVFVIVFLHACATQGEKEKPQPQPVTTIKPPENVQEDKGKHPATSISPEVLFILLSAEIAGQRGQYDLAYQGYMEAARQVNDPKPAERAAMIAMYMKDNDKLSKALSIWLAKDPGNLTARKLAILSTLKSGDKKASVEHLNAMLAADPAGFEKTVLELADGLQQEGKISFLYDVLDEVSVQNSNQSIVYYLQSLLAMQMKQLNAADAKVGQALLIQPNWDKAMMLQAQIAIVSGDLDKAERLLRNASAKYPDNDKISKLWAQVLIKKADYQGAGEIYQNIVIQNPDDLESQFALALVYFQLDRDDKSEEIFKKLLEQSQWRNQASFYLGKLEEKHGHNDKAIAWYDSITRGPFEFDAPLAAVAILMKEKQYEDVSSRLQTMELRFPKQTSRIRVMQAEVFNQQKKHDEAFRLLTEALLQDPDNKDLLYTRALIAERIGKVDVLESDLKKILQQDPDSAEALNALGYSLLQYPDRYAEAEKYLIKALRLQPDEPVIMDSYGWLQYKLGNPVKALIYLEQAYSKQQENEIAAHLVEVLWKVGRKDEARRLFDKAIKETPDDEYLLDLQKRIPLAK